MSESVQREQDTKPSGRIQISPLPGALPAAGAAVGANYRVANLAKAREAKKRKRISAEETETKRARITEEPNNDDESEEDFSKDEVNARAYPPVIAPSSGDRTVTTGSMASNIARILVASGVTVAVAGLSEWIAGRVKQGVHKRLEKGIASSDINKWTQ